MTRTALLAACVAALLLPSAATARTVTIGSTDPTGFTDISGASSSLTIVQTGSIGWDVPEGTWIARSVSARLTTDGGSAAVRFARPAGTPLHYVFLGHEPLSDLPDAATDTVFTSPSNRQVKGGDVLGVTVSNGAAIHSDNTAGPTHSFDEIDPVDGDDTTVTDSNQAGLYAVSAVLESDTDGDGYGDDSDDACRFDAEQHVAPCATDLGLGFSVTPTTVQGGQNVTATITLTNKGPERATDIVIHVPYGQRFYHGSFPAECANRQAETQCTLPALDAGQSKTIVGQIASISPNTPPQAGSPVTETLSAYVESANRDLDKSDNNPPAVAMTVLPIPVGSPAGTPGSAGCTVPKLKGLSRGKAKAKLKQAGCKLGKAKRPKGKLKKRRKLVVKKQGLKAGTQAAAGTKVPVTLKAVKK